MSLIVIKVNLQVKYTSLSFTKKKDNHNNLTQCDLAGYFILICSMTLKTMVLRSWNYYNNIVVIL